MFRVQIRHKLFQLPCLLPKVPGSADQSCQRVDRRARNPRRMQQPFPSQRLDSAFHIGPTGVLRQYRSDNDFKSSSARPPLLGPIRIKKNRKVFVQDGQRVALRRDLAQTFPRGSGGSLRMRGTGQNRVREHLFCTIVIPAMQVKNEALSALPRACPGGQVLANSQLCLKIGLHRTRAFAMLTMGMNDPGSPADVRPFR